jgi:hypothetical protein
MKFMTMTAVAFALCGATAFAQNTTTLPSDKQVQQPLPSDAANQAQNPMPGKTGGFNNDEINGKSRNPNSTTPGTGPANANPNQKQ